MLTESQLRKRKGRVTSSMAAGALGLHERMSPLQAYLSCIGEMKVEETAAMERGNLLERRLLDDALRYPTHRKGLNVKMRKAPFRVHPKHKAWAADSCDAKYLDADTGELVAIGEGKTAGMGIASKYGEEGTDDIPNGTLIQAHWHLIHWPEVDLCYVPVLVGGFQFEFRIYEVRRDNELHGILLDDLRKWHTDHVLAEKMPTADARDSEVLSRLHPVATMDQRPATRELHELCTAKYLAAREEKKAKEYHESIKARIKQWLGDHSGSSGFFGRIDWKNNKPRQVTDWESIALELGASRELIAKHTQSKPGARPLNYRPNAEEQERLAEVIAAEATQQEQSQ